MRKASKTCTVCKQVLPLLAFYEKKSASDGRTPWCKKCTKVQYKLRYGKRNWTRSKNNKRLYNLSPAITALIISSQKGRCPICAKELTGQYCIDHSHDSNVIRGIICRQCNVALGMFSDSILILQQAIKYLRSAE